MPHPDLVMIYTVDHGFKSLSQITSAEMGELRVHLANEHGISIDVSRDWSHQKLGEKHLKAHRDRGEQITKLAFNMEAERLINEAEISPFAEAMGSAHEIYTTYQSAGFTKGEALWLVGFIMGGGSSKLPENTD